MNVRGLDVAVCEPQTMNARESAGHLRSGFTHAADALFRVTQRVAELVERRAFGDLHREEEVALVGARIEHLHHAGQAEGAKSLELSPKTHRVTVVGVGARLQRNHSPIEVLRRPDVALTAPTDAVNQAIGSELESCRKWPHVRILPCASFPAPRLSVGVGRAGGRMR